MFSLGSKSNFSSAKNHQDAYLSRIYLHRDSPRQKLTPTWDRATSCRHTGAKSQIYVRFHRKAGRLASSCSAAFKILIRYANRECLSPKRRLRKPFTVAHANIQRLITRVSGPFKEIKVRRKATLGLFIRFK